MPYMTGVLEGFTKRRDQEIERELAQDADRRQSEGRIYEYLMKSNDPEMQSLALAGLFEGARPGQRQKGLSGYLGKLQGGTIYPQVRALMDQMVPTEQPGASSQGANAGVGGGPTPTGQPGAAAQTTNQPVRPGSQPIGMDGGPTGAAAAGMPPPIPGTAEELGPEADGSVAGMLGVPPPMPAAPPESRFKRRGTGVPTAEEIAESTAAAQVRGRFGQTGQLLTEAGATPEEVQEAYLAMAGRPRSARQFERATGMGIKTRDGRILPASFDNTSGQYFMPDGRTPLPPDAELVRMGSGAGTGSLKRNVIEDPQSPTGRSAVYLEPTTGEEVYRQVGIAWTEPPATSGTTTVLDENDVPVVMERPRGGGVGTVLGDQAGTQPSQMQLDAKALLDTVERTVALELRSPQGAARGVSPQRRDQIVQEEAGKMQQGFRTYSDLQRAAKATPEVSRRQARTGTAADKVLANLRRRAAGSAVVAEPPPMPAAPPARAGGPPARMGGPPRQ